MQHPININFNRYGFKLFLDLDGVFADFDDRVKILTGLHPHELTKRKLWTAVNADKDFFISLNKTDTADELWDFCKNLEPTFLTGAPMGECFRSQKVDWVEKTFGSEYKTIVLPKREKRLYSGPMNILIDDSIENIEQWSEYGYGILYTGNVQDAISKVKQFLSVHNIIL
jgi:hypothetical protein